jgi:hypothetical protein
MTMPTYRALVMWMFVAALVPLVPAVQGAPAEKAAASASAPAAKPAATPAAEAAAEPPPVREESIYIPYTKLREVFEKEGRGVFLPYEKFMDLWRAAREKTAPAVEPKPPVDFLISEAENKATVSKDVVTVAATLRIEILKEGWNAVPLRLGDVAITKATLDGEPARLVAEPGTGYKLLVEKKGKDPRQYALTLQFAKAYTKAPGQNSVSFESPQAPVSKWEVRIPESGVKVSVHPLLAATEVPQVKGAAEETVILAFVGAAPTVRLDWTPKAEGAKGLEALASVQVQQQTSIEEGVVRTRAQLAYDISRAELGRLELEVPADQKVVNVFDPNVREWSVAAAGETQKIAVQLFEPAKKSQNLAVDLEKFAADQGAIKVPLLRALGVGRQQGFLVVRVAQGLRAEAAERTGLAQVDDAELPQALRGKWDFAYRYAALPYVLSLKVEKVQPRVVAESLLEAHLGTDDLALALATIFTVERAGVFRLEFEIPEGYDLRSVQGISLGGAAAADVDAHHLEGEKKTRLVVNLSRKALGRVAIEVQLHRALHEPDLLAPTGKAAALALPIPRVVAGTVEREAGRLIIYAPESLTVNPSKSDGLRTITFAEAVRDMRSTQAKGERAVLAFAYTQEPVALALAAERRKPYVTVRQLLVTRIESGVVKYEATLFYEVQYSGVKSLRLDVPKDLASDIRITTAGIRHQPVEDAANLKDLAAGYEPWALAGESEFLGNVEVRLAWERKIEPLKVGDKIELAIPRLIPCGTDRAWGQIVLVKAETIDVQEAPEAGKVVGLRPIDPQQDLMPGASVPGAARAFEFHEDWALAVVATMYKLEEVKRTSVERALVRMVITRSDVVPVQALYRMRSARQRLLVKLPPNISFDAEPLRLTTVEREGPRAGQLVTRSVSLERGDQEGSTFYVPLLGTSPDEPFLLELRYTVTGGGLVLDGPTFPEEPAVQKVYLSVYMPEEWDYLGSRGPWTDELVWRLMGDGSLKPLAVQTDADLMEKWLLEGWARLPGLQENFPTDGSHYLFSALRPAAPPEGSLRLTAVRGTYLAIGLFVVIAGLGVALAFTRAAVRLLAIGAGIVLLVLAAVFLPTFARQIAGGSMAAAVFVVLVLWALWYLLVTRPRDPNVIARREAREAARLAAARFVASQKKSPPSAPKDDAGGETHA